MSYTLTVNVQLEGITAPLQIHGNTVNELRELVRQLQQYDMIAAQQPQAETHGPPTCPIHHRELKASQKPGTYFCPAKDDTQPNGYCKHKVKV